MDAPIILCLSLNVPFLPFAKASAEKHLVWVQVCNFFFFCNCNSEKILRLYLTLAYIITLYFVYTCIFIIMKIIDMCNRQHLQSVCKKRVSINKQSDWKLGFVGLINTALPFWKETFCSWLVWDKVHKCWCIYQHRRPWQFLSSDHTAQTYWDSDLSYTL